MIRRRLVSLALALPLLIAGCAGQMSAAQTQARAALAPTGTLRVGVYPGSPTSLVRDAKTGEKAGIAYDLGRALARELGVPLAVIEFTRVAQVLDALKAGHLDFTFTNATESRARDVDFTAPLIQLELGYLVPSGSKIATVADVDRPGVRIGVTQGSTSQGTLPRQFKHAAVVPAASLKQAQEMLVRREIDGYATNKAVLSELSDALPGSRILEGRWGVENMAIAIPRGREAGMPLLRRFVRKLRATGQLQEMIARAGLRGTARPEMNQTPSP